MKRRTWGIVLAGCVFTGQAGAAALGAGPPESQVAAPVAPTSATPAPPPVVTPVVYPKGQFAFNYSVDRDLGVTGHVMLGPRSAWLWAVTANWNKDKTRFDGAAGSISDETTEWRTGIATGYRRWLVMGQTRTFFDTLLELGYDGAVIRHRDDVTANERSRLTTRDTSAALSIALGFEYFFTPSVSIDGTVGASVEYVSHDGEYADYENGFVLDRSGNETVLNLFDAGLRVNYYW